MKPILPAATSPGAPLRGDPTRTLDQEKARLKKATQEFEAYFRYQMLKAMRRTVPESPLNGDATLSGSQGKETFLDLMDMELSRAGTGGPKSVAQILYRSTVKLLEARHARKFDNASSASPTDLRTSSTLRIPLKPPAIPLMREQSTPLPLPQNPPSAPSTDVRTTVNGHIMARYGELIEAAAEETSLDSMLIASVIHAESSGNARAVSPAGAKGLMQLADTTASDYGVSDPFDPGQNILGGSRFLKKLIDRYQDIRLALAAYNAGPSTVDRYGGLPPYRETQSYVRKVMGLMQQSADASKVP